MKFKNEFEKWLWLQKQFAIDTENKEREEMYSIVLENYRNYLTTWPK